MINTAIARVPDYTKTEAGVKLLSLSFFFRLFLSPLSALDGGELAPESSFAALLSPCPTALAFLPGTSLPLAPAVNLTWAKVSR